MERKERERKRKVEREEREREWEREEKEKEKVHKERVLKLKIEVMQKQLRNGVYTMFNELFRKNRKNDTNEAEMKYGTAGNANIEEEMSNKAAVTSSNAEKRLQEEEEECLKQIELEQKSLAEEQESLCTDKITASNTRRGDKVKKSVQNCDKNKGKNKNHDKQNDGSVISQDLFENLSETDSAIIKESASSESKDDEQISQKVEQNKNPQNVSDNLENSLADESSIEAKSETSQKRSPSKRNNVTGNKSGLNGPKTRITLSVPRTTKNGKENSETADDAIAELHRSVSLGIRHKNKIEKSPEKSNELSQIKSTPVTRSAKSKSDQEKSLNKHTIYSEQVSPRKRGKSKKNPLEGIPNDTQDAIESEDFNTSIKSGKQNIKN